jgi:mannose-6-phosphate isomerase-like protein (cupin superfamily)
MSRYIANFSKETASKSHNGTILASRVLPEGMKAPFGDAWGYLEGKSMMEAHAHPTDEVYIIVSGKGVCGIGDEKFGVKPGDVVTIPPDMMHTMECEDGETLLWAAFWWEPVK